MKVAIPVLCLGFCLAAVAGEHPHGSEHGHRPWSDVEHWSGVFDDESRREWQKPLVLLELLGIQRGEVVADLGAGTGFFAVYLSRVVGDEGTLYAVDIEQAMLDHLKLREDVEQSRVIPILAAPDDPRLPEGDVDLVVIINTWHHIEKRTKYLRRLARALSPEGRVAVIDYREGELPVGPPAGTKLPRATVVQEFEKAGWKLLSESFALPHQYFLIFFPPKKGRQPLPFAE